MLKIFTKIDVSTIQNAGLGVFTGQKIKKGEVVWEFNESTTLYFDNKEIEHMPKKIKEMFLKHGELKQENRVYYLDDSAFMNHSDDPNIFYSVSFCGDFEKDIKISMIASRDIEIGEELFYDYYCFDEEADFKLK